MMMGVHVYLTHLILLLKRDTFYTMSNLLRSPNLLTAYFSVTLGENEISQEKSLKRNLQTNTNIIVQMM